MKIFIGGVKRKHIDKFTRRWPQQEFEFAEETDSPGRWKRAAHRCHYILVYQHRTNHEQVNHVARTGKRVYLTDNTPQMFAMIEDIVAGRPIVNRHNGAPCAPIQPRG